MATAEEKYRARAAELREQSKLVQDPQVAALLEGIADCFQQLANTSSPPIVFEFPRKGLFPD